jgi:DNA gyrase subunit A
MIRHFIEHRHEVLVRRSEYDLRQALDREHILEGLKIAVDNIDEVVALIRASADTDSASTALQERFALSERQAKAILDMRLARLTGLEIGKLEAELSEVRALIAELQALLESTERRFGVIKDELREIAASYGDERRTEILGDAVRGWSYEDLIPDEEMVLTVSHAGYIKRLPLDTYRSQRRGGRGLQGMDTREEDWVEHVFTARTHDYLMVFTRRGHCYWIKVHQIPQAGRNARGKPIVNLLALGPTEQIAAVVPVREFSVDRYLMFATRRGVVKKTALAAYRNVRVVGVNAINILDGDELIDVQITSGGDQVILATREGMAIRFPEANVRQMGRVATGVRGISLAAKDRVIGMVVSSAGPSAATLLVVAENGRGKRSAIDGYRLQQRGGKGVINLRMSDRAGKVIAIKEVLPGDELILITRNGVVNRQPVDQIRVIGRNTQGVRLMALDEGDLVVDVARLVADGTVGEDRPDGDGPDGNGGETDNGGDDATLAPAGPAEEATES